MKYCKLSLFFISLNHNCTCLSETRKIANTTLACMNTGGTPGQDAPSKICQSGGTVDYSQTICSNGCRNSKLETHTDLRRWKRCMPMF